MEQRRHSPLDQLIITFDHGLRTVLGNPPATERPNPADAIDDTELTEKEIRHSAGLMRVNHAGEVAAQALYEGQALTARLPKVREKMKRAAAEENDHLLWCSQRLEALHSHTSILNPLWYGGSFVIGSLAGKIGDKWSLGFVVETENQVVAHLNEHLNSISSNDHKSLAVLAQMKTDETHHATTALEAGAAELPTPIKKLMALTSKVMTRTAYWV